MTSHIICGYFICLVKSFFAEHSNWRWYSFHNGVIGVEFRELIRDWSQIGSIEKQYVKAYINKYGYRWVYEKDRQLPNSGTYYYYIDSFYFCFLLSCLTMHLRFGSTKLLSCAATCEGVTNFTI